MNIERIHEVLDSTKPDDKISKAYDRFMFLLILISIIPIFFKQNNRVFEIINELTAIVFVFDYILRWIISGYKDGKRNIASFLKYPFTMFAIIDILSILPSIVRINKSFKLLRLLRLAKAFRVLKLLRYSKNFEVIINVAKKERQPLFVVCILAFAYVIISALVMFSIEPDSFNTFFDAFYWAVVTLTTVGYGDIYPVSVYGRIVSMISSFVGIAIVALPTGIITAGFMDEINKK